MGGKFRIAAMRDQKFAYIGENKIERRDCYLRGRMIPYYTPARNNAHLKKRRHRKHRWIPVSFLIQGYLNTACTESTIKTPQTIPGSWRKSACWRSNLFHDTTASGCPTPIVRKCELLTYTSRKKRPRREKKTSHKTILFGEAAVTKWSEKWPTRKIKMKSKCQKSARRGLESTIWWCNLSVFFLAPPAEAYSVHFNNVRFRHKLKRIGFCIVFVNGFGFSFRINENQFSSILAV